MEARRVIERCLELVPRHGDADRALHEMNHQGWSLMRAIRKLFRSS